MRYIKYFLFTLLVVATVIWLSYSFWLAYQPRQTRLQGQIEARHYSISSKVAGRIDEVFVRKGDQVQQGQLIFTIISPEINARLAQAVAGRDAAEAVAEGVEKGSRKQQIEAAREQWQKAEAAADLMEKTYQRIDSLYRDGVVAEQKRDEAYTRFLTSAHEADAALQLYRLAEEGAREEEKKAAQGKARMAAETVTEVEVYAAETHIESRRSGEVAQILLHGGELAPQGFPVVTIVDIDDAWAVFHVREDRLAEFQKGQEFEAVIPGLDNARHSFRVSHVAVMGDFATWRATSSDTGFDMRTFEVEARPVFPIKDLRVGMSILVE
ncbi:MAG: efflux RND transporter periplasmic adaptor subunit [Desulfopila sp.]|jgi:HlyD family secretion protein|nr:efflux RND transporter periplasmic adaptor subunit [Desulfopila sp.]